MTLSYRTLRGGSSVPLRLSAVLAACLALLVVAPGCSLFDDDPVTATISGRVTTEDNQPVAGARVVALLDDDERLTQTTAEDGTYTFQFDLQESEVLDVTVQVTVDGEPVEESTVSISGDDPVQSDVNFVLPLNGGGPVVSGPSGPIARLVAVAQDDVVLRVVESGGPETVSITFEGIDALGRSISASNAVPVRFRFGQNPGMGLEVNPTSTQTDASGRAVAVVSSGTRSGVVQLVAEAEGPNGSIVRSDPVRITIHGGLPSQQHFTLGPVRRNIPGRVRSNETTEMVVIVGDRYSNPVVPGTSVYFSTTHGIVEGSTLTDDDGLGEAVLRSGNPLPPDGIAVVTAETAGPNEDRVSSQTPVIFSGPTVVQVTPQSVGFQSYALTVSDADGNPLVEDTNISITATGNGAIVAGYENVTLADTGVRTTDVNGDGLLQPSEVTVITGPGRTQFPFSITRDPEVDVPTVESITIRVASENGNVEFTLTGGSALRAGGTVAEPGAGTTVRHLPDGRIEATAVW